VGIGSAAGDTPAELAQIQTTAAESVT
jgi:hypothetical protein